MRIFMFVLMMVILAYWVGVGLHNLIRKESITKIEYGFIWILAVISLLGDALTLIL